MIPKTLLQAVVVAVLLAAATGQLPKLIHELRVAQFQLIEASKASTWGRAMLLPENH